MYRRLLNGIRLILAGALLLGPGGVSAAGLAPRSITVGSSAPSSPSTVVTSYKIDATTALASNIGSIKFEFCAAPTGGCIVPTGVDTTTTTLSAQSPAGFTLNNSVNGAPFVFNAGAPFMAASTPFSYTLGNVTNPDATNTSYYVRITTYTGTDGATGPVDTGTVALSTAEPVHLTGVTPEILVFCVGTSIGSDCTTVSGNSIDFGDFSPTATRSDTSVMQAQTNAANGYAITVNGTTLASGVNTIPNLAVQTASSIGSSQFGLNLTSAGVGSGSVAGTYSNPAVYRFNNADTVATAALPTNANTFTSHYIVNIGGAQAAGVYTATMTYICTASF